MNWWNRFGTSLLFAVLVAGFYPIYFGLTGFWLGHGLAFSIYVLVTAGIYLFGIAKRPTPGLGAAFATVACGGLLLVSGGTGFELVLLTALLVGVFRSGLLNPGTRMRGGQFGRRFAREFGLLAAGLLLAKFFAQGAVFPGAFALWGFYLVQSGFFLLGGKAVRDRSPQTPLATPDPFAAALKRAREVLCESERAVQPR